MEGGAAGAAPALCVNAKVGDRTANDRRQNNLVFMIFSDPEHSAVYTTSCQADVLLIWIMSHYLAPLFRDAPTNLPSTTGGGGGRDTSWR
ncbi:hypothetical protein SBA1_1830002 [Candidatus Sulfotelmatobacter kueseliae]|uniref:Uncharacterized protein n=1 Tax=Candidatus Sulfotelmatobacter kueseliae TaxID=2042962 RepID=A0A2U3KDN5_9BACT|nr:hypothetical protein SBA1_1830002 [Candidatus Sulfotelmatobacter kueseliae]